MDYVTAVLLTHDEKDAAFPTTTNSFGYILPPFDIEPAILCVSTSAISSASETGITMAKRINWWPRPVLAYSNYICG